MPHASRRDFIRTLGVSAAITTARPLFAEARGAPAQSGDVLINYNESPYGPSPRAVTAVRAANVASVSRYHPEGHYDALRAALAAHHGVTAAHIRIGAGSTEFLKVADDIFLAGRSLVVADPAYEAVLQYAANNKASAARVPLTADRRHDLPRMAAAVAASTGLMYICNPNNPTGTIVRGDEMAALMARVPDRVTVLVDEAYAEFVTDPGFQSAVTYVQRGRNVIVAKTFSKIHGLAGMRIGYVIAKPELIARMTPFTVDFATVGASAAAALASMRDPGYTAGVARKNADERTRFAGEMRRHGLHCAESQANFVMVDLRRPVAPVIDALAKRHVFVGREFKALPTHLRVTLGTQAEMTTFYAAFGAVI